LVRPYKSEDPDAWALDFIEVSSGCSCQVNVTPRGKNDDQRTESLLDEIDELPILELTNR